MNAQRALKECRDAIRHVRLLGDHRRAFQILRAADAMAEAIEELAIYRGTWTVSADDFDGILATARAFREVAK